MDEPPVMPVVQPLGVATRCCTKCGEVKAEGEFYVKNKKTGLLMLACKKCVCADRKAYIEAHPERRSYLKPEIKERRLAKWRAQYRANPEKFRAIGLAIYYKRREAALANKKKRYYENQESEIARSAQWNREHPDRVRAWQQANRDKLRAAARKHNASHPETHIRSRHARRARKMKATCERIKPGITERLMKWQKGLCPYCRVDLNAVPHHQDHLIPLSRGGTHTEMNLQLTCKPCNLHKHAKHPFDFAAEMGIVKNPLLIAI